MAPNKNSDAEHEHTDIFSYSDRTNNSRHSDGYGTLTDIIEKNNRQSINSRNRSRSYAAKQKQPSHAKFKKHIKTDKEIYAEAARARKEAVSAKIAKKRKKNIAKKIISALCIVAVLSLTMTLAYQTGIFEGNKKNAEATDTATSRVSITENSLLKSDNTLSKQEVSEEEKPTAPTTPQYSFNRTFTLNDQKFSPATKAKLKKELTSEYMVLYDMTADEILYQRKGNQKLYPASTTKILTAIVASTIITDPQTIITVGDEIELIGEDSSIAGLEKGMKLTFEMLMDALMLPSGNDAAYTIAVNAAKIYKQDKSLKNEEAVKIFMELVNDCAKQLGANGTHFVTPDGWHDDNHYTTAENLARFAAYAKTIPLVKKSAAKPYASWELEDGTILEWENSNKLIISGNELYSEYCDGMKTGFTDEAGSSVVASATIGGHTLIAVIMNGQTLYTKYNDANVLFEEGFKLSNFDYTYGFMNQ